MRLFRPEDHQPAHDPRLLNAVDRGELAGVETLLASGTNVNSRDEDEYTPLMIAARTGHLEIFELLLNSGADPHLTAFGETALIIACSEGQVDIVKSWLSHRLTVSLDDDNGMQALLAAASASHPAIIRCLVTAGIKANEETIKYAKDLGVHAITALIEGGAHDE